jgi:hypothetical protein
MSLSQEDIDAIVDIVGDYLARSAMVMYMHTPTTSEHEHKELLGVPVCIHRYTASNGRSVALYVNPMSTRTLTLTISLGPKEDTSETQYALDDLRAKAVVDTLEAIHQLPDATPGAHTRDCHCDKCGPL